jgi:hypothetical protein
MMPCSSANEVNQQDPPAGIHIVVQLQCQQVTQAELLVHDKVLAGGLHQHLPVAVPHGRVVQVLERVGSTATVIVSCVPVNSSASQAPVW